MKLSRKGQDSPVRSSQPTSISILEQNNRIKELRSEFMKRQSNFAEMISQARAGSFLKQSGKHK